jgi:glycosyltransferase involved in cell wall biosynthesis
MKDNSYILYLLSFIPTYVYWEINELLRRGIDVKILILGNSSRLMMWEKISKSNINDKLVKKYPVDVREINGIEVYENVAKDLSEFLLRERIKRIHVHFAKKEAQIGIRLAEILDVPFSVTTHANDIFVPQNYDELKYLLDSSAQIFTISEFNKSYLKKFLNETEIQKIKVTYLGINLNHLPQRIKKNKDNFKIWCTASGLVEKKGIRYLIQACEILKTKGISLKCTIAGSDPDSKVLDKLKEEVKNLCLSELVELPGIIPSESLLQEIAESDVFILPCIQADNGDMDGIPVSLIEAMGIGIPVVSTSISGIPELIQNNENGLLIPPKNPKAIADALIYIFEHPFESEKMGDSARQTVKNKFSIEGNINQLLGYWEINSKKISSESLTLLSN